MTADYDDLMDQARPPIVAAKTQVERSITKPGNWVEVGDWLSEVDAALNRGTDIPRHEVETVINNAGDKCDAARESILRVKHPDWMLVEAGKNLANALHSLRQALRHWQRQEGGND